jgi:5-methyltetrahydrofolate--homocysteine methyltransferase
MERGEYGKRVRFLGESFEGAETAGGVAATAAQWNDVGRYLDGIILQSLALEGTEAFAEWLHQRIRRQWGIEAAGKKSVKSVLRGRYRGIRVSFGLPCCPSLEGQRSLFSMLEVTERIGVRLTDSLMMEPEASVSALVLHHPAARHFAV